MTMNIERTMQDLVELRRMKEELDSKIKELEGEVKEFLGDRDEAVIGPYRVTYKPVISNRLDQTALVNFLGKDTLAEFYKRQTSRTFRIYA